MQREVTIRYIFISNRMENLIIITILLTVGISEGVGNRNP